MRKTRWMVLAAALFALPLPAAQAGDWWHRFWASVKTDFKRNNAWPNTFQYPERAAVHTPFQVQTFNGWRVQNTLGNSYFAAHTSDLNEAGRLKVHSILTEAPPAYRAIFIERSADRQVNEDRIEAIRKFALDYTNNPADVLVMENAVPVRGWPANDIYTTYVKFQEGRAVPVLPQRTGNNGN